MIYLIDFENVHEEGFSSLGRLGDRDAVYCFFTKNVAKISMAALAGMRSGQLHFIEAESGKQSLDLALVSYLGYLIGTTPNENCYEIVSNDNGFAKAADFWNKHGNGLRVRVRKTVDQKPKPAADEAAPKPAAKSSSSRRRKSTAKPVSVPAPAPETPKSAPEASKPTPQPSKTAEEKPASAPKSPAPEPKATPQPMRSEGKPGGKEVPSEPAAQVPAPAAPAPEAVAALVNAGIEAPVAEFLLTEAEKHREDKNIKQLVYRAVVKKYGQKKGTEIYNTAKKIAI